MLTLFDPQPGATELPDCFPDPFTEGPPHPLARRAADDLRARMRTGALAAGIDLGGMDRPGRGKMFGVLAVATADGRVGYLCGFSGMLGEQWVVDGFVPPLFDLSSRDAYWPAVEAELYALEDRLTALTEGPEAVSLRTRLAELERAQEVELHALRARHQANRAARRLRREVAAVSPEGERQEVLDALARQSRADEDEGRVLRRAQLRAREELLTPLRLIDAQRKELEHARAERSRALWREIGESYRLPNARGEERSVASLFAPSPVPGGAGDCAAPKLLGWAYRNGLRPLALAEFWYGAPPTTGRQTGEYQPACSRRCGVVLPWMMQGL